MDISLNWIKEFVELPELSQEELANRYTLGCAEIEEIKSTNAHLEKMQVAEIVSFEPHPNADKLKLVTFDLGGETRQVVCGAANVKVGLKTPYCPVGVTLPIGLTLEPKKIRGVLSEGMLCSEEELGWSAKSSGIMELDSKAIAGQPFKEYLKATSDTIINVDNKSLTHRPDLWGHYGQAREFAALFNRKLKNPYDQTWRANLEGHYSADEAPIKCRLEGESACLLYLGLSLSNVEIGPSPSWMQERLKSVGLRPINNMVDISNYVMLELGIPLHIFDRDKINGGEVVVKELSESIVFETLDEQTRNLIPGDTIIGDQNGPLVLAGIMGGLNSGVTEKTTNLFIEVANWKSAPIRQTSTRLGLRTDSSSRYEKTLDSQLCSRTMLRTLELVLELCPQAKVVGSLQAVGQDLEPPRSLIIQTSTAKINSVLGISLDESEIVSMFEKLEFHVEKKNKDLLVQVPSYRATKDIEYEADLIEEIGRLVGYDNIMPSSPLLDIRPVDLMTEKQIARKIQDFMSLHARSFEVMSYPLVGEKLYQKASWKFEDRLILKNALSVDHDRMRNSMIPSFLEMAALNCKHHHQARFFELGRVYLPHEKNYFDEQRHLAVAYYEESSSPFIPLVNDMERLCEYLHLPYDIVLEPGKFKCALVDENWSGVHPHESVDIRVMGKFEGKILSVHPLVLRDFKIKGNLSFAILNLSAFDKRSLKEKVKYKPLNKHPKSVFDWTVIADKSQQLANGLLALKKLKIKELESVGIVDIFERTDGKSAITLRAVFSDSLKTLDGAFLEQAKEKVINIMEKENFPLKID